MKLSLNFLFILLSAGTWTLANAYGPSCECYSTQGANELPLPPGMAREPPKEKYYVQTLSERDIDMDSTASHLKQEILRVANACCCSLRPTYKEYLKRLKSDFNGKITLKFTIAPSGETSDVSIVSSTTDYPEFDNAIKNEIKNWIWKIIKRSETTATIATVTFTFYIQE